MIDSCVLLCRRCEIILLNGNIRCHLGKQHKELLNSTEFSILNLVTKHQYQSSYVKIAKCEITDKNVYAEKMKKIENIPVDLGYRCKFFNAAAFSVSNLEKTHERFYGHVCKGSANDFEQCKMQIIGIGNRLVGFGVLEDDDIYESRENFAFEA